jgi:hypothetical protein
MANEQFPKFCGNCRQMTMHFRKGTNTTLNVLLTIVTVGGWLPFWILLLLMRSGGWTCQECGKVGGSFGRLLVKGVAFAIFLSVVLFVVISIQNQNSPSSTPGTGQSVVPSPATTQPVAVPPAP